MARPVCSPDAGRRNPCDIELREPSSRPVATGRRLGAAMQVLGHYLAAPSSVLSFRGRAYSTPSWTCKSKTTPPAVRALADCISRGSLRLHERASASWVAILPSRGSPARPLLAARQPCPLRAVDGTLAARAVPRALPGAAVQAARPSRRCFVAAVRATRVGWCGDRLQLDADVVVGSVHRLCRPENLGAHRRREGRWALARRPPMWAGPRHAALCGASGR